VICVSLQWRLLSLLVPAHCWLLLQSQTIPQLAIAAVLAAFIGALAVTIVVVGLGMVRGTFVVADASPHFMPALHASPVRRAARGVPRGGVGPRAPTRVNSPLGVSPAFC